MIRPPFYSDWIGRGPGWTGGLGRWRALCLRPPWPSSGRLMPPCRDEASGGPGPEQSLAQNTWLGERSCLPPRALSHVLIYILRSLLLKRGKDSDILLPTGPKRVEDPVDAASSLCQGAVACLGLHAGILALAARALAAWALGRRCYSRWHHQLLTRLYCACGAYTGWTPRGNMPGAALSDSSYLCGLVMTGRALSQAVSCVSSRGMMLTGTRTGICAGDIVAGRRRIRPRR